MIKSLWNKYNLQNKLIISFSAYCISIYSGYTGKIGFLFNYIPAKRNTEIYLWEIMAVVSTLVISYYIKNKMSERYEENRRLIIGIMMSIIGFLIILNI